MTVVLHTACAVRRWCLCGSSILVPVSSLLLPLFRFRLELWLFAGFVTRVNDEDDGRHCAGEDLEGPKSKDRNQVKARFSQVYLRCEIGLNELKHTLLQPGCCVLHLNSDCSSAYTLSPENRQSKCVCLAWWIIMHSLSRCWMRWKIRSEL